jgi:hypothetical protein
MPTGTGRGGGRGGDDFPYGDNQGGGQNRGGRGGGQPNANNLPQGADPFDYDQQTGERIRVKVGVAWINGDKAGPYLPDMLADEVYFRMSLDDFDQIPEGWRIFGFPNKNKKGKAPDIDFVALPPKEDNSGGGGRGGRY